MKQRNLIFLLLSFTSLLFSCQKEYSGENAIIPPFLNSNWTTNPITASTHPARLTLNASQPADINTNFNNSIGTIIPLGSIFVVVPSSCFVKLNNSPVIGNVNLKIKKATKFSEMIAYNLATVTNNGLLSTDGMIKLEPTQGTDILKIASGKTISISFQKSSNNNYIGFEGVTNNTLVNNVTWRANTLWQVQSDSIGSQGIGPSTRIMIDSCQWVNCDYFYNQPNPTNVYLKLPSEYGNTNTVCYVVFRADKVMSGLVGDPNTQKFWQGANYKLPIGKQVRLIAISKRDTRIYYGSADVTITADMTVTINTLDEVSDAELQLRLNAL